MPTSNQQLVHICSKQRLLKKQWQTKLGVKKEFSYEDIISLFKAHLQNCMYRFYRLSIIICCLKCCKAKRVLLEIYIYIYHSINTY